MSLYMSLTYIVFIICAYDENNRFL